MHLKDQTPLYPLSGSGYRVSLLNLERIAKPLNGINGVGLD
ncbi:TPA: hypothetical protein ACTXXA_003062 [Legionella anisa]